MLDLVDENCLGMLSMPASITAGTNQETSCWVNHYRLISARLPARVQDSTYASEKRNHHGVQV